MESNLVLINKKSLIGAPCISIKQPWAWAIFNAGKDIENRDWATKFRGRILIHVGKNYDNDGIHSLSKEYNIVVPNSLLIGGIIGSVEIVDCVEKSDSKWFCGKYGFVLRNQKPFKFIPYRGQLGIFKITKEGLGL